MKKEKKSDPRTEGAILTYFFFWPTSIVGVAVMNGTEVGFAELKETANIVGTSLTDFIVTPICWFAYMGSMFRLILFRQSSRFAPNIADRCLGYYRSINLRFIKASLSFIQHRLLIFNIVALVGPSFIARSLLPQYWTDNQAIFDRPIFDLLKLRQAPILFSIFNSYTFRLLTCNFWLLAFRFLFFIYNFLLLSSKIKTWQSIQ